MAFFNNNFYNGLKDNVVDKIFPNLNKKEKDMLWKCLVEIIDHVAVKFHFDNTKVGIYEAQFTQNNYRDSIGFLLMLLPYINDDSGDKKRELKTLNEIYVKKQKDVDINKVAPEYVFSNLQYGRCKRIGGKAEEIVFVKGHLEDNCNLLKFTIGEIANKLFVNWINVRPFLLDYKDKSLFKGTVEYLKNGGENKGMDIGEIYNTMANFLYNDILNIKWLLYDIVGDNNKLLKLPYVLDRMVGLGKCVKGEDDKEFGENWSGLVTAFKLGLGYKGFGSGAVEIILVSVITFGKNYIVGRFGDKIKNKFDNIYNDDVEEDYDLSENKRSISREDLIKNIKNLLIDVNIDSNIIYDYLIKCFAKLGKTAYWKYYLICNPDGTYGLEPNDSSLIYHYHDYLGPNYDTTIKCLYNYAKALCHYNQGNYKTYALHWKSNGTNVRTILEGRIKNRNNGWFNITGILKRRGTGGDGNNIFNYIQENLAHIVFFTLLGVGMLNEFVVDPMIGGSSPLPLGTDELKQEIPKRIMNNITNGGNYDKCIYFLDNKPYGVHFVGDKPYLQTIGDWVTHYAMDWVSQIGTFHHYLHNRVIYVTGGTGLGKSTSFPKLLLYAMKMCDWKSDGMIGCTAPRINALLNNSDTIANTMGVPINKKDKGNNNVAIPNFSIQYKYSGPSHDKDIYGLKLKILTDGILALPSNQLMKTGTMEDYGLKNAYDIVMIDEAHEHNVNMDIILTRMRYATYFNNDVKLVIVSATMDEDEPVYRRYYRMINDNKMFPLNKILEDNGLDRINVDRRMHISPVGSVTQFPIKEYYAPYGNGINGENLVLKILNETDSGDILLFESGVNKIKKAVSYLNSQTTGRGDIIALPYYSDLQQGIKDVIEKLNTGSKKEIPFSKEELIADPMGIKLGGKRAYNRIIIVATDIAEASITIPTLRYVVDTGMQKVNKFDLSVRSEILREQPISESSRVQRKGRVGRVAEGTVYYTYEKGAVSGNKRPYKIAVSGIMDNLFGLLALSDKLLFDRGNDPNWINSKDMEFGAKGIKEIVGGQYYTNDNYFDYKGNVGYYDYDSDRALIPLCYLDGYDMKTLYDEDGSFYIVHPDEICLDRNILGKIVKLKDDDICKDIADGAFKDGKYISRKINIFKMMMQEYLLIVVGSDGGVVKTEFGELVMKMRQSILGLGTIGLLLSYIYGLKYGCADNILKYLVVVSSGTLIKDLGLKGRGDDITTLYGNKEGDYDGCVRIMDFVIGWFDNVYGKIGKGGDFKENINKIKKSGYFKDFVNMCVNKGLDYEKILGLYVRYMGIMDDLKGPKVKNIIDKLQNVTPLLIQNYKTFTKHDIATFCLISANPNHLLKKLTEHFYLNMMAPSIYSVYNVSSGNTLIKDSYVGDVVLYMTSKPDDDTDSEVVMYVENINYKLIPDLLPLVMMDRKKGFSVKGYKEHMEKYINSLIVNDNPLKYAIVNNYVNTVKDIEYKLWNNFDKSKVLGVMVIAGKNNRVRRIIENDYMNMSGGEMIMGKETDFTFAKYLLRIG